MGKASRTKREARAAGKRRAVARGRRRPWGFYSLIGLLVVAGSAGVALTVNSGGAVGAGDGQGPGPNDHWHAAYAVDVCGTTQPVLPQPATLLGLHTHGDGLIHVEPYVTGSALDRGANATLARFAEGEPGFTLTSTTLTYPGGTAKKNGDMCDTTPGRVTIRVWPDANADAYTDSSNPKDVKITDGSAVTVAFVPAGADIPKPTTVANLSNPNAGETATTPTS